MVEVEVVVVVVVGVVVVMRVVVVVVVVAAGPSAPPAPAALAAPHFGLQPAWRCRQGAEAGPACVRDERRETEGKREGRSEIREKRDKTV